MSTDSEVTVVRKKNHLRLLASGDVNAGGDFVKFDMTEVEQSIPARFEAIALKYPERLAIKTMTGEVTFGELNQAANCIARMILARRGSGREPVGLLLGNDSPMAAAMLGTLKAGKFYVPLDPSLPETRLKFMLQDSQAELVLTDTGNASLAGDLGPGEVAWIDGQSLIRNLGAENLGVKISPDDYAWIIYTSGSTGEPKGVIQNHRNVLHYVGNYTNGLRLSSSDRLLLLFSFAVNAAAHEIFSGLLNGGSLFPFDIKREGLSKLSRWLTEQKLTIYSSVPTVFRNFCESLNGRESFSSVRLIKLLGESVSYRDVSLYKKHFSPECVLINRLGSTETGSIRWFFIDKTTAIQDQAVPVGYPVPDNEVVLLDERGQEVPAGEIGEICVESRYLSPGYWRKPEATQKVFLSNSENKERRIYRTGDLGRMLTDGCLLHLGRTDFQIKIGGHRIEIGEVEAALSNVTGVREAVVVARADRRGAQRLIGYLRVQDPGKFEGDRIRSILAKTLPVHMIPSVFQIVDCFPMAPNGKLIRNSLPSPEWIRPDLGVGFVAPRSEVECSLAEIWVEILSLDRVGIHDDFFELGGNSLLAIQVISRVFKKFELELAVQSLFQSPTVAEMAFVITQSRAKKLSEQELIRVLGELDSMSEEEAQKSLVCGARKDLRRDSM